MPVSIPFLKSETNYTLVCPIGDVPILFNVRWNSREKAFYIDMYEADDTVIALNIKVVTGIQLARRSQHDFFGNHTMTAVDTSNRGLDPGFDDLGDRVEIIIQTPEDLS